MPTVEHDEDDDPPELGFAPDEVEISPLPIAPDGGIKHLAVAPEPPAPPSIPENFVCLRGPCRHYVEMSSLADVDARTLGREPIQINRFCNFMRREMDLTAGLIFSCNAWDPEEPDGGRAQRRTAFLKEHPECVTADKVRADAIAKGFTDDDNDDEEDA